MGKVNIRVLSLCLALALCMPLAMPVRAVDLPASAEKFGTATPDGAEVPAESENAEAQEIANEADLSPETDQENANESPDQGGETGEDAQGKTQEPNQSPESDQGMNGESPTEDPETAVPDFSDVPADSTFYGGIMDCAMKGIVSGYADGTFKPGNSVTRAQFCVMLSRAFYSEQAEALSTDANKTQGWFVPNTMALSDAGILTNTTFAASYDRPSVMDCVISRYDMAQLMTNIMKAKGFTATNAQKTAAQPKITDYKSIPSQYQDAVKNVYALGIISGYSGGNFGGTGNMTRGAGATVIDRMMKYAPAQSTNPDEYDDGKDMKPETPATPSTPSTGTTGSTTGNTGTDSGNNNNIEETPKSTTVTVTKTTYGKNTGWAVSDNGWGTGKLNNGKTVTEANVLAMLNEAKKTWYSGMSWNGSNSGTNCYDHRDYAVTVTNSSRTIGPIKSEVNGVVAPMSTTGGCSGFACMISDYVFGANSNPLRKLDDPTQVRPGDIVLRCNSKGLVKHVMVATGTVKDYDGMPCLFDKYEGNLSQQVQWSNDAPIRLDVNIIIYTRYPA